MLTQENEELLAANKKQQKKRKSQYISEEDAAKHIQRDETEVNDSVQQRDSGSVWRDEAQMNVAGTQETTLIKRQASRCCDLCGSTEHNACRCSCE